MSKETESQLLQEVRSINERLARIEETLSAIRQELSRKDRMSPEEYAEIDRRLAAAAEKALPDYLPGGDLWLGD